jgi:hypothetical protein
VNAGLTAAKALGVQLGRAALERLAVRIEHFVFSGDEN